MRLRRPVAKALKEQIRLEIFGSAGVPDYWLHLLSDGSFE